MGRAQEPLKHYTAERALILHERRAAQGRNSVLYWHTRRKADRDAANAEIADYLHRVPHPPVYD